MNRPELGGDLPEPVRRYFVEVADMEPPNDLLDAAIAEIERTPRRNRFALPVLGSAVAAAVLIALVIGAQFLGSPGDIGSGEPTPSPEATAIEPSSSASVASRPFPLGDCRRFPELEAGTYGEAIGDSSVTVSVPIGWYGDRSRDGFKVRSHNCLLAGGVSLEVSLVSHVYSSACDGQGTAVETGSPAAVIAALAAQTDHRTTTGPSDTTIAGYPATRLEFSTSGGPETCNGGALWRTPGGSEGPTMYWGEGSGKFLTVYVVDVDGSALGIAVDSGAPDEPADLAELDAIVDSLRIEPLSGVVPIGVEQPLNAGSYFLSEFPVGITFEIPAFEPPAEWFSCSPSPVEQAVCHVSNPDENIPGAAVTFQIVDNVRTPPCSDQETAELLDPPVGPSVDDLVTAISNLEGYEAGFHEAVTVSGFRGMEFTLWAPDTEGCTATWATAEQTTGMVPNEIKSVWVLDVDGVRVVISFAYHQETPAAAAAAVLGIIDSVQIQP